MFESGEEDGEWNIGNSFNVVGFLSRSRYQNGPRKDGWDKDNWNTLIVKR